MWIFLRSKLPTRPSPPRFSIHWAIPWVDETAVAQQKAKLAQFYNDAIYTNSHEITRETDRIFSPPGFGFEPNEMGAVGILYDDQIIRVYPHEFSRVTPQNFTFYLLGEGGGPAYDYVPIGPESRNLLREFEAGGFGMGNVYEAAQIDGCTKRLALYVAIGGVYDPDLGILELPPIFWFEMIPAYAVLMGADGSDLERTERKIDPDLESIKKQTAVVWN